MDKLAEQIIAWGILGGLLTIVFLVVVAWFFGFGSWIAGSVVGLRVGILKSTGAFALAFVVALVISTALSLTVGDRLHLLEWAHLLIGCVFYGFFVARFNDLPLWKGTLVGFFGSIFGVVLIWLAAFLLASRSPASGTASHGTEIELQDR